jgi:hypothetical protein
LHLHPPQVPLLVADPFSGKKVRKHVHALGGDDVPVVSGCQFDVVNVVGGIQEDLVLDLLFAYRPCHDPRKRVALFRG